MPIAKLFKVNKLGPLGLVAAVTCMVGIFLPWKVATISAAGKTLTIMSPGIYEPMGWIMAILIVLYVLLLFANFKWNILLGVALFLMSIYQWWMLRAEVAINQQANVSYGLYVIMISSLVMSISKLLLFRKQKTNQPAEEKYSDKPNSDMSSTNS
jgi:ABC-type transport system involved in cytochrome bd biosynthesis fused ATPase/permease subunit